MTPGPKLLTTWSLCSQSSQSCRGDRYRISHIDLRQAEISMILRCYWSLVEEKSHFWNRFYLFFRERGREGERGREVYVYLCVGASCVPPTGDLAHNPGICPNWELNWQPFHLQASTESTEPHQPGWKEVILMREISSIIGECLESSEGSKPSAGYVGEGRWVVRGCLPGSGNGCSTAAAGIEGWMIHTDNDDTSQLLQVRAPGSHSL